MMDEEKPKRRSAHRTQWAAQFAVASELCKRGYEVAFTMGNHPSADLMAIGPNGTALTIDVKGLYKPNYWVVKAKPLKDGLFYVFAYVPDSAPNEFFILDQMQVNAEIAAEIQRARARAEAKGKRGEKAEAFPCIPWGVAKKYNDWGILPS
jgi:hypothetical protein